MGQIRHSTLVIPLKNSQKIIIDFIREDCDKRAPQTRLRVNLRRARQNLRAKPKNPRTPVRRSPWPAEALCGGGLCEGGTEVEKENPHEN